MQRHTVVARQGPRQAHISYAIMIVPQYWAESRIQHRQDNRQLTLRRFGWSDTSEEDAQAHADTRAQQALQRVLSGEKLRRREPKTPYNGAEGVPIREEVVERIEDIVITRNAYGARCLNTPKVLFADIDFDDGATPRITFVVAGLLLVYAALVGWAFHSKSLGILLAVAALIFSPLLARGLRRVITAMRGGEETIARKRIVHFLARHPDWGMRLYRTPAGLRLLATHRTFDPREPSVPAFFKAVKADPLYALMCANQHCFRARVSPKPWRIGIAGHIRPRPGVWPIKPERLPERRAWIAQYEAAARAFAACVFVESLGNCSIDPHVIPVQTLHDRLCKAFGKLPVA